MADIHDIRQRRLRDILKNEFKGVQRELAEKLERDPNYVSRVLSSGPNRKKIGEDFAREIEKHLHLAPGALDRDGTDKLASSRLTDRVAEPLIARLYGHDVSEEAVMFAQEWEKLRAPLKAQIQTMVETLVAEQIRASRKKSRENKPDSSQRPSLGRD